MTSKRRVSKRVFHEEWTRDYLFIPWQGKALCMVCSKVIAHIKVFNIKRHYNAFHKDIYSHVCGTSRYDLVQHLRNGLPLSGQKPVKKLDRTATHEVAMRIVGSGRSCDDGNFLKDCMVAVAKLVIPDKVKVFEDLDLSTETLKSNIDDISRSLNSRLVRLSKEFSCYSLAIDDYRDHTADVQFITFIRGVTKDLTVVEEYLGVISNEEATSSGKFCHSIIKLLSDRCPQLQLESLVGITANKSSIVSKELNSVASLLKSNVELNDFSGLLGMADSVVVIHCFLRQVAHCMQILTADDALEVANKCIDLLRANPDFQIPSLSDSLLAESQKSHLEHPEVGWIENVKILEPFFQHIDHIQNFLKDNNITLTTKDGADICSMLSDTAWLVDLAFLVDISRHIEAMFLSLTSSSQFISEIYFSVEKFKCSLSVFKSQIEKGDLANFPSILSLVVRKEHDADFIKYGLMCKDLDDGFKKSFKDLSTTTEHLQLFCNPFLYDAKDMVKSIFFERELNHLKSDCMLRELFEQTSLHDFYKYMDEEAYPCLVGNARFWIAQFGTTYNCKIIYGNVVKRKASLINSISNNSCLDAELLLSSSVKQKSLSTMSSCNVDC